MGTDSAKGGKSNRAFRLDAQGTQTAQLQQKDFKILRGGSPHLIQTIVTQYALPKMEKNQYSQHNAGEMNFGDPAADQRVELKALCCLGGVTDIFSLSDLQTNRQPTGRQLGNNQQRQQFNQQRGKLKLMGV